MDGKDHVNPGPDLADAIAFRAAMRDDPSAPGTSDEGGPVAQGRIELGYPFEDADVLADLFLNDGPTVARIGPGGLVKPAAPIAKEPFFQEAKPQASAAPARGISSKQSPEIELLLVGHLPVLGSAWVLQYAKHVAQKTGCPVGLVRMSGGEASIDLTLPPSEVPPRSGPMPSIADAVHYVSERTGRWIVRLDESADRATPADIASSIHAVDRVTVLTGADEAAVVGCYRVIKTLEPGEATPHLHVAVMGSVAERSEEAAAKLSRAAEKFLQSRVTSEACSAKITPGSSVNVYRGRPNAGHADLIALLKGGPAPTEQQLEREPALDAPEMYDDEELLVESDRFDESPVSSHAETALIEPAVIAPPVSRAQPTAAAVETKVVAENSVRPPAANTGTTGLARHLTNLESIASRCPYAPDVELAIDPQGRLHLIARATEDPGWALGALTTASAWAQAHSTLIGLAHPKLRSAGAICHLMTAEPKSVRRLGDGDIRLHLLTAPPGTREQDVGWVCVELN
ncbi:MAG: hypothetical protein KF691_06260 [Phycisphaeraceae bacterium]|nr:hypothetical protein [Phycisphaeraceae bacterium]